MPDTSNEADGIAGDVKTEQTVLSTVDGPTIRGAGTVALLNLGIDPAARSTEGSAGGGPGGPPPDAHTGIGDLLPTTDTAA